MIVKKTFYLEKSLLRILLPLITIIEANIVILPSAFNKQNLYGFNITNGKKMNDIESKKIPVKKITSPN
jgi:hypothetical protein